MSNKYTLLTFKGICMNFLLKLKFFILSHAVPLNSLTKSSRYLWDTLYNKIKLRVEIGTKKSFIQTICIRISNCIAFCVLYWRFFFFIKVLQALCKGSMFEFLFKF